MERKAKNQTNKNPHKIGKKFQKKKAFVIFRIGNNNINQKE